MTVLVLVALWLALLVGWWGVGRGLVSSGLGQSVVPTSDEPTG